MYDPSIFAGTTGTATASATTPMDYYVIEHPSGADLLITDVHIIRHIATATGNVTILRVLENGIIIKATAADAIGLEQQLWRVLPNIRIRALPSWDACDRNPENPDEEII